MGLFLRKNQSPVPNLSTHYAQPVPKDSKGAAESTPAAPHERSGPLLRGNGVDLHQCAHRQGGHLIADARRHLRGEELGIHGIHGRKIADMLQQNRGLHHVAVSVARFAEDMAQVGERLARLRLDALGHAARFGVDRQLARDIECAGSLNGLRIGTHGFRSVGRCDDLFHGFGIFRIYDKDTIYCLYL